MNYDDPELRDRLTTEYALGTLRGPARRRFERLVAGDRELARKVENWELRLNHLAESALTLEPPPRLWANIAEELWAAPRSERQAWFHRLWADLRFWRTLSALGAAAAAALVLHIALRPPQAELMEARLQRIDLLLQPHPGLFLAGNSYRGVAINSCIAEAGGIADRVLAHAAVAAAARPQLV